MDFKEIILTLLGGILAIGVVIGLCDLETKNSNENFEISNAEEVPPVENELWVKMYTQDLLSEFFN